MNISCKSIPDLYSLTYYPIDFTSRPCGMKSTQRVSIRTFSLKQTDFNPSDKTVLPRNLSEILLALSPVLEGRAKVAEKVEL